MKNKNPQKAAADRASRRHARVRAVISGTASRPRLSVSRSLKHVRVQLIDDVAKRTVCAAVDTELTGTVTAEGRTGKVARSYAVGMLLAEKAKKAGISTVVFDRGSSRYHGRVAAVADGARAGGLVF